MIDTYDVQWLMHVNVDNLLREYPVLNIKIYIDVLSDKKSYRTKKTTKRLIIRRRYLLTYWKQLKIFLKFWNRWLIRMICSDWSVSLSTIYYVSILVLNINTYIEPISDYIANMQRKNTYYQKKILLNTYIHI